MKQLIIAVVLFVACVALITGQFFIGFGNRYQDLVILAFLLAPLALIWIGVRLSTLNPKLVWLWWLIVIFLYVSLILLVPFQE